MGKNILAGLALFIFALSAFAQRPNQAKLMGDREITRIVSAINEGEIAAADIAKGKASSQAVKNFAAMMIDQHTKNAAEATDIATRNKLTPESNQMATKIKREADALAVQLKKSKNFDKDYMDSQVKMHAEALHLLDTDLIPKANNLELKTFLEKTRAAVDKHLAEAKTVSVGL